MPMVEENFVDMRREDFCRNCRWRTTYRGGDYCSHPDVVVFNAVVGYEHHKCELERSEEGQCKPEGRLFEKVPSLSWWQRLCSRFIEPAEGTEWTGYR